MRGRARPRTSLATAPDRNTWAYDSSDWSASSRPGGLHRPAALPTALFAVRRPKSKPDPGRHARPRSLGSSLGSALRQLSPPRKSTRPRLQRPIARGPKARAPRPTGPRSLPRPDRPVPPAPCRTRRGCRGHRSVGTDPTPRAESEHQDADGVKTGFDAAQLIAWNH